MATVTVTQLDAWIKASPPGVKRYSVAQNLFLQVTRKTEGSTSASWVFRWRFEGKDRSAGIGRYVPQGGKGAGVTLKAAIDSAAALRSKIKTGTGDLSAARRVERARVQTAESLAKKERQDALLALEQARKAAEARAQRTVQAACVEWHTATAGRLSSDKYRAQRLRRLEDYFPHLGDTPVESLTVADVADAFDKMRKAMRARGKREGAGFSGAETLRRSSADLERALAFAASKGWFAGVNPVTAARTFLDKPKVEGRRFFDVARLPDFWRSVLKADTGERYPVTAQLLRLLTLTAARTLELRALRWDEVEGLEGDTPIVRVPANRMKRRVPWTIPLSHEAAEVLRQVREWQREAGQALRDVKAGLVFVHIDGNYKGRMLSENAVNDLLQRMGWGEELTAHGLRKVFSTVAHDGWPYHGPNRTEAIEYSLSHAPADRVRGIYDKNEFLDKRRALMAWWASHLMKVQ
jgi:integrase